MKWNFVIDAALCHGCQNCFLACKDEHVGNAWPGYAAPQEKHGPGWIDVPRKERGQYPLIDVSYLPTPCMHCRQAPCEAAGMGAIHRRADGIVLIDPVKAKGRRELVDACPYGRIVWNQAEQVPQKCTFCAHLIDQGWREPRCVQACPTGALRVERVDDSTMEHKVQAEGLEFLHPEFGTEPRAYYKNLYRYEKCFIAGSVAASENGVTDCVSGAQVTLFLGEERTQTASTDAFGDFKFDGLDAGSGPYTLLVRSGENREQRVNCGALAASINLGVIRFA